MIRTGDRFAFVVEVDISVDNGPGINEREFIRSLLECYPEQVTCFVPSLSRALPWTDPGLITVAGGTRGLIPYLQFLSSATYALLRANRERRFSAIVFRPGGTPLLPVAVSWLSGVPIILKKLGLYSIFGPGSRRSKFKNLVSRILLPLYRRMIRSAAAADCESAPHVPWLVSTFGTLPARISVIPNGVNTDLFKPGDRHERCRELGFERFDGLLGYVGALSPLRNVDLLIRAFGDCSLPDSKGLLIVGDGPLRSDLEQLAASLGLADRVVFTGSVPYERVPAVMQALDIGVDLTAVQMQIGGQLEIASYSQKIPQYLASGLPVLVWRCEDTDFVERVQVGESVQFGSELGVRDAIRTLFERRSQDLERMRKTARRYAIEHYSYPKLAQRRIEMWSRVADEYRVPPRSRTAP